MTTIPFWMSLSGEECCSNWLMTSVHASSRGLGKECDIGSVLA